MEKNKRYYILLLLLPLLSGCEEVVYLGAGKQPSRIVVNSILETGADSILVQVSLTQAISNSKDWFRVKDAEVTLFKNGIESVKFKAGDPGWYSIHETVIPDTIYRIEVKVPGYGIAWGETQVPKPIQNGKIEIIKKKYYATALVDIYWTDDANSRNFYWSGTASTQTYPPPDTQEERDASIMYLHNFYHSRSTLIDPFNRVTDELEEIPISYEYMMRIEDSGLAGSQLHLPFRSGGYGWKFKAFLLNVDIHYDAYLKSSILNRENTDVTEDLFLYYTPAYTYSNIHGGVGLVASYTGIEKSHITNNEKPSFPDNI